MVEAFDVSSTVVTPKKRLLDARSIPFLLTAALYLLGWLVVMPTWYRYVINPDGISYISIAEKYLRGDFWDAVNGYWGPLYSWLLMPLLAAGVEPLLAARVLGGILGLCAFGTLTLMAGHFGLSNQGRYAVGLAAVPVVLFFSVYGVMADLLLSILLLLYVYFVLRLDHAPVAYGLSTGGFGAVAYLAKSYALPFFLAHLLLITVCHLFHPDRRSPRRIVLRNALCALAVFGLISGTWIGLLTQKYHRFTWSTSGPFNMAKLAPAADQLRPSRLAPPPNDSAIDEWEDPSYYELPTWRAYQSLWDFAYYCWKIMQNVRDTIVALLEFSGLTGAIVLLLILLMFDSAVLRLETDKTLYPLLTIAVFCSGYTLVLVESRYLWFCCFLLLLMGGYGYEQLVCGNTFFTKARRMGLLAAFALSFAFMPLFRIAYFRNMGRASHECAQVLSPYIEPGDRIASDGAREDSAFIAYHLNARYYGVCGLDEESRADLQQYDVAHYLVWGKVDSGALCLAGYRQLPIQRTGMPLLYSRTEVKPSGPAGTTP